MRLPWGCPAQKRKISIFELADQETGATIIESITDFSCKSQCRKVQIKSEPGYMEISIR